jgi:hypothetical protein
MVVSFADKKGRYLDSLKRQAQSLQKFNIEYKHYTNVYEIGSPMHLYNPYAFKAYALDKKEGVVIWLDSVVYAKKPLTDFVNYIKKNGACFFDNIGYSVADYCNDKCLNYYGITREEAKEIKMIMACCMGFDFNNPLAVQVFNEYKKACADGIFKGDWTNHRHDQTCMSIIIHKLGINPLIGHETFFTYEGHEGMQPVNDSVCLFSK